MEWLHGTSDRELARLHERRSVLFLIDVEPDARKTPDAAGGWEGSESALKYLEDMRSKLEEATGVRVQLNWFLRADPQIERTWGRARIGARQIRLILEWIRQGRFPLDDY